MNREDEFLISIIIPVYNTEKYLIRCLDSIVKQTYRNIEIIIICDKSEDKSKDICDVFAKKDQRIVVIHRKRGDIASARNNGLEICRGKYVIFVDSDDWIELDFCKVIYETVLSSREVDIIIFDAFFELTNKTIYRHKYNCKYVELSAKEKRLELAKRIIEKDSNTGIDAVWGKAFKGSFVRRFRFEKMQCEDALFSLISVLEATKCVYVDKILYHYYINMNSSLNRINVHRVDEYKDFYERCTDVITNYKLDTSFVSCLNNRICKEIITIIMGEVEQIKSIYDYYSSRRDLKSTLSYPVYFNALKNFSIFTSCISLKRRIMIVLIKAKCYALVFIMARIKRKYNKKQGR